MDNLFEIREDIRYRTEFEQKMKSSFSVLQFYFTMEKLIVFHKRYDDYKLNRDSNRFMTGVLKGCRINREPKVGFSISNSFDEYLEDLVFKGVMPAQYQLVDMPHIHAPLSQIKKCLSNWDFICKLYKEIKTRIKLSKDTNLELVDDEPSVITLNKLLSDEEIRDFSTLPEKDIKLPKVPLLPIKKFWEYHHSDAKDFLGGLIFLCILGVMGAIGVYLQQQPYTWIGTVLISLMAAIIIGVSLYNLLLVATHGKSANKSWVTALIAILCGAGIFGSSYEVIPEYQDNLPIQSLYHPSSGENLPDEMTVYTMEYGECYHSTKNCPSLSRSRCIYPATKADAKKHYRPCSKCN